MNLLAKDNLVITSGNVRIEEYKVEMKRKRISDHSNNCIDINFLENHGTVFCKKILIETLCQWIEPLRFGYQWQHASLKEHSIVYIYERGRRFSINSMKSSFRVINVLTKQLSTLIAWTILGLERPMHKAIFTKHRRGLDYHSEISIIVSLDRLPNDFSRFLSRNCFTFHLSIEDYWNDILSASVRWRHWTWKYSNWFKLAPVEFLWRKREWNKKNWIA